MEEKKDDCAPEKIDEMPLPETETDKTKIGELEAAENSSSFWTPANIGGVAFVVLLIAFNLVIYSGALDNLGKGDSLSGPGLSQSSNPTIPEPLSVAPEPPPPGQVKSSSMSFSNGRPQENVGADQQAEKRGMPRPIPNAPPPPPQIKAPAVIARNQVYGTQLVSGFIYFSRSQDPKLRLTDEQMAKGREILGELVQSFPKVNDLLTKCVSCFTPEQIEWARAHRGEPNLAGYKAKDKAGYQPVVAYAIELLQKKANRGGNSKLYIHKAIDFQAQDVGNMIVKLEAVPSLAVTAEQAAAVLPLLRELADFDKKRENQIRQNLGNVLSNAQLEWLGENMDTVRLDYHNILILYALEIMKSDRTPAPSKKKGK